MAGLPRAASRQPRCLAQRLFPCSCSDTLSLSHQPLHEATSPFHTIMSYTDRLAPPRSAMADTRSAFEAAIWQIRSQSPSFEDDADSETDVANTQSERSAQTNAAVPFADRPSTPTPRPGARLQQWQYEQQTQYEPHDGWWPEPHTLSPAFQIPRLSVPDDYPPGNATITYPGGNGETASITKLNISLIEQRSPLLAAAFEPYRNGERLNLDTLTETTAMPLVRYLYSGSYAEADFWEDVPTSVLLHCQMFQLGSFYDLEELKSQAYVNILRQCEFGCSSADKPIDLCAAIQFSYDHLKASPQVTDSIVHYCVSCFLSHQLGEDAEFKQLAYDLRPFHQDLVKVCRSRGFDDESAMAIIRMPYKPYLPATYASNEHPAIARFEDLIYHFHGDDDEDKPQSSPQKRQRLSTDVKRSIFLTERRAAKAPETSQSALSLALRPGSSHVTGYGARAAAKPATPVALPVRQQAAPPEDVVEDSSASEDEGFHVVRKRPASTMSASSTQPLLPAASDSDFEILSGPEAVESASSGCESGDDSDTDTLVDVPTSASSTARAAAGARASESRDADGSSSDSEWELF